MKHKHTKKTLLEKLQKFTQNKRRLPNTHRVKLQLIRVGLLKNHCSECKLTSWNGKEISLHLDHADGDATNNLLQNLRLLCPNCHSQTPTYCGKNNKDKTKKYKKGRCKSCSKELSTSWAIRCITCYNKYRVSNTKIDWPTKAALKTMLADRSSMESLAATLGVSSNALRKRCRKLNLDWHCLNVIDDF